MYGMMSFQLKLVSKLTLSAENWWSICRTGQVAMELQMVRPVSAVTTLTWSYWPHGSAGNTEGIKKPTEKKEKSLE